MSDPAAGSFRMHHGDPTIEYEIDDLGGTFVRKVVPLMRRVKLVEVRIRVRGIGTLVVRAESDDRRERETG